MITFFCWVGVKWVFWDSFSVQIIYTQESLSVPQGGKKSRNQQLSPSLLPSALSFPCLPEPLEWTLYLSPASSLASRSVLNTAVKCLQVKFCHSAPSGKVCCGCILMSITAEAEVLMVTHPATLPFQLRFKHSLASLLGLLLWLSALLECSSYRPPDGYSFPVFAQVCSFQWCLPISKFIHHPPLPSTNKNL